jgi:small subunit ribosomal protein S10
MEMKTNAKIRVRLESFNAKLLVSSCQKIIDTLHSHSLNSIGMITLPTAKRIYCVLRSPHVDKDSREHFEIRVHKRVLEIHYDSKAVPILDLLSEIDLAPGILYRIRLST